MGETRVDLHHLLEDLRDAYPGALEETILTEVVANSLDSGVTCLRLTADAALSVVLALSVMTGTEIQERVSCRRKRHRSLLKARRLKRNQVNRPLCRTLRPA